MKLKYILPLFVAALAFLTGCSDDQDPTYQDGLRVSSSYITLPLEGGSKTITLKADADWTFIDQTWDVPETDANGNVVRDDKGNVKTKKITAPSPTWLTINPTSGSAGETQMTISAKAGEYGQVVKLKVRCGGLVQEINVQQGLPTPELATCADVIAGPDGKQFRVKGRVTTIANTTYGNWFLADDTGEVYIYGTLDKDGKTKNFSSLNIEVGDVVTIEGPKKTYNGTVELVDVTVVKIEKTLVKVITDPAKVAKEGGEIKVEVEYKGIGLVPTIPSDCNWIHQTDLRLEEGKVTAVDPNPASKAFITYKVDANEGEARKADIVFKSMKNNNESSVTYTIEQAANILPHGENPDDPFTVAEAIAKCKEIGGTSDGKIYYAKGTISSIQEVNVEKGNATFNISDDGTDNGALTVFRSKYLNNENFTALDQINVGDEVIICGKLVNYKDATPEFSGSVYIYKQTKASNDPGTKNNPFDIAGVISFIDGGGTGEVYVKGVVSEVVNAFEAEHGNGTFWISDDGTKHGDSLKDFEAYRVLWLGNKKWAEGDGQIAVGDKVVICGEVTLYKSKSIYETVQNKAYLYSVNGNTK